MLEKQAFREGSRSAASNFPREQPLEMVVKLLNLLQNLLKQRVEDDIRESILVHTARDQFSILKDNKAVQRLEEWIAKQKKLLE